VSEIGKLIGTQHATYEFPSDAESDAAYKAADRLAGEKKHSVSSWRYADAAKTHFYVTVITEDKHRAQLGAAERLFEGRGGTPVDIEQLEPGFLDALRMRRLSALAQSARRGEKELAERAHFAAGAVLYPSGRMGPYKRPQG
jgi:hypothetical protein